MTTEYGNTLLQPFKDAAKRDNDVYFVCHFSRLEDKFTGDHHGLDTFDAMILIKQLVKDFKIDSTLLNTALMTEQTKEAIVAAGEIANWARIELVKYKEAIEELKVCISKLPIEANYFGNVDRMKYIINKL